MDNDTRGRAVAGQPLEEQPLAPSLVPVGEASSQDGLSAWKRTWSKAAPHLAYIIAGSSFALVSAKLLIVANFSASVALGLLASADTGRMLVAIAISVAPSIALATAVLAGMFAVGLATSARRRQDRRWRPAVVVTMVAGLVAVASVPFGFLGGTLVGVVVVVGVERLVTILAGAVSRRLRLTPSDDSRPDPLPDFLVMLLVVALVLLWLPLAFGPPWMPSEQLTFTDGTRQSGYVVDNSNGWLTYLTIDRQLIFVPSASLSGRRTCSVAGDDPRTLGQFLASAPQPPTCG
jgi:hypothetical protein